MIVKLILITTIFYEHKCLFADVLNVHILYLSIHEDSEQKLHLCTRYTSINICNVLFKHNAIGLFLPLVLSF